MKKTCDYKTQYDALFTIARDGLSELSKEQLLAIEKELERNRDLTRFYTDLEIAIMGAEAVLRQLAGNNDASDFDPAIVYLRRKYPETPEDIQFVKNFDFVFGRNK